MFYEDHTLLWKVVSWIFLMKIACSWNMNLIMLFSSLSLAYMYVLRKRYKDFKSSQIAMNKSLELERSTSGASIHTNISSASGYKVDIRNKNSID